MRLSALFQVFFRCFFFFVLERGDFAHVAVGVRLLDAAAGARAAGETKGASRRSKRRRVDKTARWLRLAGRLVDRNAYP